MVSKRSTLENYRLPKIVRALSATGDVLSKLGLRTSLSSESLHSAAQRSTGLSDFGETYYREALQQLLHALDDADLSSFGRYTMRAELTRSLANRLLIQQELARHPEILNENIRRPVFILGFPRTGTTLLHRLFTFLPGARLPLLWELTFPALSPKDQALRRDSRPARTDAHIRGLRYLAPHLFSIHPISNDEPEECFHLLENSFMSPSYPFYLWVPRYIQWLYHADMTPAYRYYKVQLQLLHYQKPGEQWILKWPGHLANLDALHRVFPDVCVIQTHRNLRAVAPSTCSYAATLRKLFSRQASLDAMGAEWIEGSHRFLERADRGRASLPKAQIFDLTYNELMADPIGQVRRICEQFNLPCPPAAENEMRQYLAAHPADKHGIHRYSPEQFGLSGEAIDREFKSYHEQFRL